MSKSASKKSHHDSETEKLNRINLVKYRKGLAELSKKFPHIKTLLIKYPKLAEVMVRDSAVREVIMSHAKNIDVLELISEYLSNRFDEAVRYIEKTKGEINLDKSETLFESLNNLFGDDNRTERVNCDYELFVIMFENNLASSSIPELLYDREILAVKALLGHSPNGSWEDLSVFHFLPTGFDELSLDLISEVDKLLVNGQEQEIVDFAVSNESLEVLDLIISTRTLQKYLLFLEHKKPSDADQRIDKKKSTAADVLSHNIKFKVLVGQEEKWNANNVNLFRKLQSDGFIDGNEEDFVKIFNGIMPEQKIDIIGFGSNKNFIHLMDRLSTKYKIIELPYHYFIAYTTFFLFEGKEIKDTANLRKETSALKNGGPESKRGQAIDSILEELFK